MLERRRKFRASKYYNTPVTEEGARRLGEFVNNLSAVRRLIRFGLHNFDDRGRVHVEDAQTALRGYEDGGEFLTDLIQYFEGKDEVYAYNYCAELKKLHGAYIRKFR